MGKRIIQQRRGRGSPTYRVPEYSFKPKVMYKKMNGVVKDIIRDPKRDAPLAEIKYEDNTTGYIIAMDGMKVGDEVKTYVTSLQNVSEGEKISCLETSPNSGPKLCRAPGSGAVIVSKTEKECIVQLPSKKKIKLHPECMVTVGVPAGEGRNEKPVIKAGKKWHAMHARGKLYPRTSGVAMNAVDHPFGSGYTGLGRAKTVSRHAPPGRKVGSLAAKKTGKRR
ncbi:MAG: 50S ribosomal protein L2 [Candidatus Aenigmatarchaeota archaeon]|nr:MAG: 50S ribosomal protein L2 [Candidatus Aenigmarchaeota archaeon]RLJ08943.1 MAG: 50S ribosomal protein L2 [Candidatus Aenigmarchaeota archaeon]RLJ09301.1 MAG: 50S ribosomal protein L2 [Candidatus Aenigmarchaeota archaeon]